MMNKSGFGAVVLAAVIALTIVGPANATIADHNWTNPVRRDFTDGYLGYVRVVYARGSKADLIVNVQNNRGFDAYFMLKVKMSWALENVTATEYMIFRGDAHLFELEINIPSGVSNRHKHSYTIYSLWKAAPGDPWSTDHVYTVGDFAVYSSEQSEINSLKLMLDAYPSWTLVPFLNSAKARELMINASVHKSLGIQSYSRGDFAGALEHYTQALSATEDAYAADTEYSSSLERSLVALLNAYPSYLSMQGYALIIAAIGFLLIGIGAMIYLTRRSKPPTVA